MTHASRGLAVLALVLAACGGAEAPPSDEPFDPSNSGSSGDSGRSGQSGGQGASGATGRSGKSGTSGTPASSGKSGSSGGASGKSGGTGSSGKSGRSGSTGSTGSSGKSGSSGTTPTTGTPVEVHGKLSVKDGKMVDQNGQPVQLRGVSSMWLNWEKTGYAQNLEGLKWLRDSWKLSLIRVATPLELEGELIAADQRAAYKQILETVIANATQLGVYVLVDLHSHEANAFESEAVSFFDDISKKYGDRPNVLYETFNEPLKVSWSEVLKPYHEKLVSTIRANDPDNIIILGTPNWSQDVDAAALDPVSGTNLMYTLHFYACTHGEWLMQKADTAFAKKLPMFVTEWGATDADGGVKNKRVCGAEGPGDGRGVAADDWHDWMKMRSIGWAAWKFDDCTDSSCFFKSGAPTNGGWTDEWLQGHGPYVRDKMRAP